MIRTLIIDDEQDARENLRILIDTYCNNRVEVIDESDNIKSGIQSINQLKPDVVLLDIEIGDENGFELLEQVSFKDFSLIFTTGYSEFAVKAFRYDALDYLLKPIHPDQLVAAFTKAENKNPYHQFSTHLKQLVPGKESTKIGIPLKNEIVFVTVEEIIRIKGDGNYSYIFMENGDRIVASKNLKTMEALIPNKYFFRTHQSHLINFKYIQKILFEDGTFILTTDGIKTPVSRNRKEMVKTFIKDLFEQ